MLANNESEFHTHFLKEEKMKTLGKIILFVVSFIITVLAYRWLFGNWALAGILIVSLVLHEVGHYLAYRSYGLKPSIYIIPILGAATRIPDIKKLNHKQGAIATLAGPATNFVLFLLGCIIYLKGNPYGLQLASVNALFVFFNLIPLPMLDGQYFVKALLASLDGIQNTILMGALFGVTVEVEFGLMLIGKWGFLYIPLLLGISLALRKSNLQVADGCEAMTFSNAKWLTVIYAVMVFSTLIGMAFAPFWGIR